MYFNHNPYHDRGLVVTGKMGSGKSLYLQNYINDCVKKGDSIVVIDYIKNSNLTSNIKEIVPEDKLVVLDFENTENLQSLSYNELNHNDSMSKNDKMRVIHHKAIYTLNLLNILNDKELSNSAKRYFLSVSSIVYAVDNSASIEDMINFLIDQNTRMDYINKISKDLKEMLEDEINTALRLNNVSSRLDSVEEILDIIYLMKDSMQANFMLKKSSKNNINFEKCFKDGKVICIKIDDDTFNGSNIKDMLALFFVTKTYLACKNRTEREFELNPPCKLNAVHIIIDEVNSLCPNTLKEINNNLLSCIRPYYLKPVLTTHKLSQLPNNVLEIMRLSGFNYMFLSGLDKETYKMLESEFSPYRFKDINNIERYHSVNLIAGHKGYYEPFITKLPSILK